MANDSGLVIERLTDESIALMRRRIGYSNPTLRGSLELGPWNRTASKDAIRHWALGNGKANPANSRPARHHKPSPKSLKAPAAGGGGASEITADGVSLKTYKEIKVLMPDWINPSLTKPSEDAARTYANCATGIMTQGPA